ncbi:aryl-sulfate sulfotransferase [Pricia sp.]|uniref:aryl-sulfate sulfotransferase n=1 Tax=Pricia sp. TaxID=2268138 RepID=UPI00359454E1
MKAHVLKFFLASAALGLLSCTEAVEAPLLPTEENQDTVNPAPEVDVETENTKIEVLDRNLVDDNFILINEASANRVFIMDKNAVIIHEWPLNGNRLGNDAYLLPNGKLLAMLEDNDAQLKLGGFGGKILLLSKDGDVEWDFKFSSEDFIAHHDAEMLPNGNIIFQVWERKSAESAVEAGYHSDMELIVDAIFEIDPSSDEIVWQWHAWDHLVQMHDSLKSNFGDVGSNPQLVDLNYVADDTGDIMHANGLTYDAENDIIFLSVNFYSEIWVIDHSTTTDQASMHTGGRLNKGGDLIYRFGNPEAYQNTKGKRLFDHQHYPNLLDGPDLGNMLVFSNGSTENQSTVYELQLPKTFSLDPAVDNEPNVVWSFTHPELYAPKVSGAERLPNGNTLITEGDFGIWEVTYDKQVVWKYKEKGFYWRGYHFDKDSEAIKNLDLN